MSNTKNVMKIIISWMLVILFTAIIYLTLPYGPILREKIYKSFPPKIIETYPLKHKSFQIKESWGVLYSAEGEHGVGIYDISKPDSVIEMSRVTSHDTAFSFIEARKIIYLADGKAGVNIIDVTQPSVPKELNRIKLSGKAFDVIMSEHYLLVASGEGGLLIFDISDKENPVLIFSLSSGCSCQKISQHGNLAIIGTDRAGIYFVDLSDIANPKVVQTIAMPAAVTAMLVQENFVYVACLNHGIKIIDISDLSSPKEIGFYATASRVHQMSYRNGYLFAANDDVGLVLINVNKPEQPRLQRIFTTGDPITHIYSRYYYAYLTDTSPNAYFVDIDTGRNVVVYFVAFVLFLIFVIMIVYFIRSRRHRTMYNYLSLGIIAVVYGYFLHGMLEIPIEAIHFLEYGFLSVLVYFAFKNHLADALIFFVSSALITMIGIGDEFFQWLLPNRSWDFRDVGFNALSGGLVQLAIWHGIAPLLIKNKISKKSIRLLSRYLIAVALAFAILLSLTPQNNNRLANRFPFLKFLKNPESITEYGYKIFHDDIGGFFSRLEESKLLQFDRDQARSVAEILNKHHRTSYKDFLEMYASGNAPFIHEMRVHIFRRDRYFQDRQLWVAYKENLILEKFFSNSLEGSLYKWRGDEMQRCREQLGDQVNDFYVSPVSENVITSFSLQMVWIIFLVFAGLMLGLEFFIIAHLH